MTYDGEKFAESLGKAVALASLKNKGLIKEGAWLAALIPLAKWAASLAAMWGGFKVLENWPYLMSYLNPGKHLAGLLPKERELAEKYIKQNYSPAYAAEMAKSLAGAAEGLPGESLHAIAKAPPDMRAQLIEKTRAAKQLAKQYLESVPKAEDIAAQREYLAATTDEIAKMLGEFNTRLKMLEQNQLQWNDLLASKMNALSGPASDPLADLANYVQARLV